MTEKEYRATLAKAEQGDVVRIRWRDSTRMDLGWSETDDYLKRLDALLTALEETAGYFVGANAGFVLIASSLSGTGWADGGDDHRHVVQSMAVPHEAIRTFEILATGKKLDRGSTATGEVV